MTTTDSEMMEDPVRPVIDDELVDRLMAQVDAEGLELLGPEGVLTELTSRILSRGLEVEMADHLGYEKGDPAGWGSGNNRNGSGLSSFLCEVVVHVVGSRRPGKVMANALSACFHPWVRACQVFCVRLWFMLSGRGVRGR